jgi:GT2 family glycosyltransferase
MDISIIIVSYNTIDLIGPCLESVLRAGCTKEVFVVDNKSSDGSSAFIRESFPNVHLVENRENRGFGAANNQVLKDCRGRYLFFLNPDTTVLHDTFTSAMTYMEKQPNVGLAGLNMVNPDGSHQPSVSYRYPGEKYTRNEMADLKGPIACVLGAAMIARPDIINRLLGFDEDFFLYGDDQDLCLRIRRLGHEIGYIEYAKVLHWGGQSEINTTPVALLEKKLKAEYLFYKKHYTQKTITRIKQAEKFKAVYRLITLKLVIPFCRNRIQLQNKIDRYRLIYDMTKSRY